MRAKRMPCGDRGPQVPGNWSRVVTGDPMARPSFSEGRHFPPAPVRCPIATVRERTDGAPSARLGDPTRNVGDLVGLVDVTLDQTLGVGAKWRRHYVVALPDLQNNARINHHD